MTITEQDLKNGEAWAEGNPQEIRAVTKQYVLDLINEVRRQKAALDDWNLLADIREQQYQNARNLINRCRSEIPKLEREHKRLAVIGRKVEDLLDLHYGLEITTQTCGDCQCNCIDGYAVINKYGKQLSYRSSLRDALEEALNVK